MKLRFIVYTLTLIILGLLLPTSILYAQPEYEIRYYDVGSHTDAFNDVFPTQDGGYVVCGSKNSGNAAQGIVMKLNAEMEMEWIYTHMPHSCFYSVIETDNREILVGGSHDGFF